MVGCDGAARVPMKRARAKLQCVRWIDSSSLTGWWTDFSIADQHVCISVGFIVREDKDGIWIAGTACDATALGDFQASCIMAIPKRAIVSRRAMKLPPR